MTTRTGTQAVGELGRYFPSGFKEKVALAYVERLRREDLTDPDISEGVERVIATRTQRTFPPFAELRGKTMDARSERLGAHRDRERQVRGPAFQLTEAQQEAATAQFRDLRAKYKSGELVPEYPECPAYLRESEMPVRGVPRSSPSHRSESWWQLHPNQPAGVTLRIGKVQWVSWKDDRRPWAEAEALHDKLSPHEKPRRTSLTPIADVIDAVELF